MRFSDYSFAACALLFSGALAQTSNNSSAGPVVDLGYAQYRGNTTFRSNYSTDVFYGIRFAQAPVGQLRWQPPQNIEAHNDYNPSEVMDAESPSPSCVQGTPAWQLEANQTGPVPVDGQEDCLLLDVYVPEEPTSTALPVLVNIHGGGYTQGSAYGNAWQGMVNASGGSMIYVASQYRLGAYGFLSSSEVRENGQANAGLLDQRYSLQWVQRNIRSFGGDPSKVTIIGGSAGGGSGESICRMRGRLHTLTCSCSYGSDDHVRRRRKPSVPGCDFGVPMVAAVSRSHN
jgi:carboxylesterase type B